jgi:Rieske Fe-S protein
MDDREAGRSAIGPRSRRRFLVDGFLGGSVAALWAAVVYPVLRYVSPPRIPEATTNSVLAGKVSEIGQRKWKLFPFGSEAGILVEFSPGDYRAFSATCTHLECTVQYEEASRRIWCACHNGYYNLEGRNVAGPPPRPLTPYQVKVVGDEIFVSRA